MIDLHTGRERPARPDDYCTKETGASPGGACPLWHKFLNRVTAGNKDLQAYLQRVAGYCLTGVTTEHALFFLHGGGANGKSVFVSTLLGVWGDYAAVAAMETFTEAKSDRHPTELAHLQGARLVVAQETEAGRYWAESRIKTLTSGDKISARFMRQDLFEFVPQFKLMIAGNHKPSLRDVDEAIRRRFHLIPFTVTIPPAERDPKLVEKLKEEWGGILQWAIGGCRLWQEKGLAPPAVVTDATAEYLDAEDGFAQWVRENCLVGKQHFGVGDRLWRSWSGWAETGNERAGTRKAFAETLKARGFLPKKEKEVRGYEGIDLRGYADEPF
jgi:putative DNA primase/helicase